MPLCSERICAYNEGAYTLWPAQASTRELSALYTFWLGDDLRMDINGFWIAVLGVVALPGGAIITRWMSPVGQKTIGMLAGLLGGIIAIGLLEVLAGLPHYITPLISGVDAFGAAVVSFFTVSAASAAIGLLVNWAVSSWQSGSESEEALAE